MSRELSNQAPTPRQQQAALREHLAGELQDLVSDRENDEARRRVWARVVSNILADDPRAGDPPARPQQLDDGKAEGIA